MIPANRDSHSEPVPTKLPTHTTSRDRINTTAHNKRPGSPVSPASSGILRKNCTAGSGKITTKSCTSTAGHTVAPMSSKAPVPPDTLMVFWELLPTNKRQALMRIGEDVIWERLHVLLLRQNLCVGCQEAVYRDVEVLKEDLQERVGPCFIEVSKRSVCLREDMLGDMDILCLLQRAAEVQSEEAEEALHDSGCPSVDSPALSYEYLVDVVAVVFKEHLEHAYGMAMQQSLQMESLLLEEEDRKDESSERRRQRRRKKRKNKKKKKQTDKVPKPETKSPEAKSGMRRLRRSRNGNATGSGREGSGMMVARRSPVQRGYNTTAAARHQPGALTLPPPQCSTNTTRGQSRHASALLDASAAVARGAASIVEGTLKRPHRRGRSSATIGANAGHPCTDSIAVRHRDSASPPQPPHRKGPLKVVTKAAVNMRKEQKHVQCAVSPPKSSSSSRTRAIASGSTSSQKKQSSTTVGVTEAKPPPGAPKLTSAGCSSSSDVKVAKPGVKEIFNEEVDLEVEAFKKKLENSTRQNRPKIKVKLPKGAFSGVQWLKTK